MVASALCSSCFVYTPCSIVYTLGSLVKPPLLTSHSFVNTLCSIVNTPCPIVNTLCSIVNTLC